MAGRLIVAVTLAALAVLAGCASAPERRGMRGPVKVRALSCPAIARERDRIERDTTRLFLSLRRRGVLGTRSEAETLALWPTLMFLKGPDSRDRARFARLQSGYADLRARSSAQSCGHAFADDVTKAVRLGPSPEARRINQIVGEETGR